MQLQHSLPTTIYKTRLPQLSFDHSLPLPYQGTLSLPSRSGTVLFNLHWHVPSSFNFIHTSHAPPPSTHSFTSHARLHTLTPPPNIEPQSNHHHSSNTHRISSNNPHHHPHHSLHHTTADTDTKSPHHATANTNAYSNPNATVTAVITNSTTAYANANAPICTFPSYIDDTAFITPHELTPLLHATADTDANSLHHATAITDAYSNPNATITAVITNSTTAYTNANAPICTLPSYIDGTTLITPYELTPTHHAPADPLQHVWNPPYTPRPLYPLHHPLW